MLAFFIHPLFPMDFLRRKVVWQQRLGIFCAAGLFGSSASGFSAPQGCLAVAPQEFLRRRVVWQQRLGIFCAARLFGSSASGFSALQGCASKNGDFFLRRRLVRQKIIIRKTKRCEIVKRSVRLHKTKCTFSEFPPRIKDALKLKNLRASFSPCMNNCSSFLNFLRAMPWLSKMSSRLAGVKDNRSLSR